MLILDTDGGVVGETDSIRAAHATATIGGRDAAAVIKPETDLS